MREENYRNFYLPGARNNVKRFVHQEYQSAAFPGDIIRKAFEQLGSNLNDDHYYSLKDIEQHRGRCFGENATHLLITMLEAGIEKAVEAQKKKVPTSAEALCAYVLGINKHIRFAGVAGNMGGLVARAYREGLSPLLNERESSLAVAHTIICAETRRPLEKKLGRAIFSYTLFENVEGHDRRQDRVRRDRHPDSVA